MKTATLAFCTFLAASGIATETEADTAESPPPQTNPQAPGTLGATVDDLSLTVLGRLGFGRLEKIEDGHIHFVGASWHFELRRYNDSDLLLSWAARGPACTAEAMNLWNRRIRGSRAYLDDEGALVLESDFFATGTADDQRLERFFQEFLQTLIQFQVFIAGACQGTTSGEGVCPGEVTPSLQL